MFQACFVWQHQHILRSDFDLVCVCVFVRERERECVCVCLQAACNPLTDDGNHGIDHYLFVRDFISVCNYNMLS